MVNDDHKSYVISEYPPRAGRKGLRDCQDCKYFEKGAHPKGGLCRFSSEPIPASDTDSCPGHYYPGEAIREYVPFPDEEGTRPPNLEVIRKFISEVEWRFAKTMPDAPHWYTVLKWNPDKSEGFFSLAKAIFERGDKETWVSPSGTSHRRRYFHLDGNKYWSMDPSIDETDLINRAFIDKGGSK